MQPELTQDALPTLRALVVEPNTAQRRQLVEWMRWHGVEVIGCANMDQGRMLYDEHPLVMTPLNGDNRVVKEFVKWLRTHAGNVQPFIVGMGETEDGSTGCNRTVAAPVSAEDLQLSIEAARRWHGWESPAVVDFSGYDPADVFAVSNTTDLLPPSWQGVEDRPIVDEPPSVSGRETDEATSDLNDPGFWQVPDGFASAEETETQSAPEDSLATVAEVIPNKDNPFRMDELEDASAGIPGPAASSPERETLSTEEDDEMPAWEEQEDAEMLAEEQEEELVEELDEADAVEAMSDADEGDSSASDAAFWAPPQEEAGEEDAAAFWSLEPETAESTAPELAELPELAEPAESEESPDGQSRAFTAPNVVDATNLFGHKTAFSTTPDEMAALREELAEAHEALAAARQEAAAAREESAKLSSELASAREALTASISAREATAEVLRRELAEAESRAQEAVVAAAEDRERSAFFKNIAETAPLGLILLDDEANAVYANPQFQALLGRPLGEGGISAWLEESITEAADAQKAAVDSWWEKVWRRRLPYALTLRSAEGILKEIEFRPSALPGHQLLVAVFDVTEARREEESMRASEARFRAIFQGSNSGIVVVNASGNICDSNPVFERLAGASRHDIRRLGLAEFFPAEDLAAARELAAAVDAEKAPAALTTKLLPRGGEPIPVSLSVSLVKNSHGTTVFAAYYLHPLSAMAAAPAAAEPPSDMPTELKDPIAAAVPDLVVELAPDGIILGNLPSRDFSALLPKDRPLVGMEFTEAFPILAESLPLGRMMEDLDKADDEEVEVRCDFWIEAASDVPRRFCEARMLRRIDVPPRYCLIIRDITNAAKTLTAAKSEAPAKAAQSASSEKMDLSVLRHLRQVVIVTNEKGRIVDINPAAEKLFGYARAELLDQGLYKLFLPNQPAEFARRISEHINKHKCWIGRSTYFRKDGSTGRLAIELVPFEEGTQRGFVGIIRDITTEERLTAPPADATTEKNPVFPAKEVPPPTAGPPVVTLHRARNDLQVLSSLLSMQAADANIDAATREALVEGKDRVGAVALVYRLLDSATGQVDFGKFCQELGAQILRSHEAQDRIRVVVKAGDIKLPQKLAISLAILLHELISASVRISFAAAAKGTIEISLALGGGEGILVVKDDGPLQTDETIAKRMKGFSWQVVEALVEQIRGQARMRSDIENEVRVRFRSP